MAKESLEEDTTPVLDSSVVTKRSIDTTTMSLGELVPSPSKLDTPNRDMKVREDGDVTLRRSSLDEVLLEELMTHSVLTRAQGTLSGRLGGSQRPAADSSYSSKGREHPPE